MNENICWCGVGFIGFVVFDKSIQFDNESVLLFIIEENDVKKFLTNEVKECLKSEKNPSAIHKMTQKYYKWKNNPHSHNRLENLIKESPISCRELKHKIEERHANKLKKIKEKHKQHLEISGLEYRGVKFNSKKIVRTTHCYSCKEPLDSTIDLECNSCNWIICGCCGACGCGYSPDYS